MSWRPALCNSFYGRRPEPGWRIGFRGEAYLIVAVTDRERCDWEEHDVAAAAGWAKASPWPRRPFTVEVTKIGGGDRLHGMHIHDRHTPEPWHRLPEHYAVCVSCGNLAPCISHQAALQAAREIERAVKAMSVPDGFCPACSEPVTNRQKCQGFPAPNVVNPLGSPHVRFHLRRKCLDGARRYEELWVAAEPGRKRTMLTASCKGTVIVHQDGTGECFGDMDCPGLRARHRGWCACYAQSAGCGRGCTREGHPGIRLAKHVR